MDDLKMLLRRIMDNPLHGWVALVVIALAFGSAILSWFLESLAVTWFPGFLQSFSTNMFSVLLIFFLIELFWSEGKELQQLNGELRSSNNLIAIGAIEKARMRGMLHDGSFKRQIFWYANWEGANLQGAVLRGSSLMGTNLKGVNLLHADIKGVDFSDAQFDTSSILPNGKHWKSDQDLERFI